MRRSVEESKKAEHCRHKAEAVGRGGISSDDPEAIEKLTAKIEQAEKFQEAVKAANKVIRSKPKNESTPEKIAALLKIIGTSEERIAKLFKPDFAGRIGFAGYVLTNNNANLRRMKERRETLQRNQERTAAAPVIGTGFEITEHPDDNRLRVTFDKKPDREVCRMMRGNGFVFSRENMAWQRQLNNGARAAADQVKDALDKIAERDA